MKHIIFTLTFALLLCSTHGLRAEDAAEAEADVESEKTTESPYTHAAVRKSVFGKGGSQYWLFEPAKPKPDNAPVIVFIHGWMGMDPGSYGAWLDHLARQGYIVIYPRYQENFATLPTAFMPNSVNAIKDALNRLEDEEDRVRPDKDNFAAVGHSVGGLLVANLAAIAEEMELPKVKAVFSVQPGRSDIVTLANMKKMPADTYLLALASDSDSVVGTADARRIFTQSTNVPAERKDFIFVRSDRNAFPWMVAHHLTPCAAHPDYAADEIAKVNGLPADKLPEPDQPVDKGRFGVDNFDTEGYWRLFDDLLAVALNGADATELMNGSDRQKSLGRRKNGKKITELMVLDKP